jgi:cytochrome c553
MNRIFVTALIVGLVGFAGVAQAAGDVAAGEAKAAGCAMCHGPGGHGTQVAPKLAGEDPTKFIQALKDFQSGKRDNAMMKGQVAPLSADDMTNLAAYYASIN